MVKLVKIIGWVFAVIFILIVFGVFFLQTRKSGYASCVVAIHSDAFIGRNLRFEGEAERMTVKTEDCMALDNKLDDGDGPVKGRVRWVECPLGPDCDEAGMN